jgi:acylphosphatase
VIQRRVVITGRVQGVTFRASALEEAQKYPSLCGFVRNRTDGKVEALFAGEDEEVLSMVAWCRKGPPLAKVSSFEVKEEEYSPSLQGFHIVR